MASEHPDYGCDLCGQPKDAHQGDGLVCPGQAFGHVRWREPRGWVDDGHALTAVIRFGSVAPRLVHPEGGCTPAFCICRGEEYIDAEANPDCENCGGTGHEPNIPCWLQHVVEEMGTEFWECSDWRPDVPVAEPVPILYHGGWDDFRWRPRGVAA